jgi:hypothetical protein
MKGNNFGWKGLWVSNPDLSYLRLISLRKSGTHVGSAWLGKIQAVPCLLVLHPGIRLTTEGKIMDETKVRVIEECWMGTIQYVDITPF